ncbi:MAG: efflux RND transporter periplasmic adaptor subunit [Cyanobacteria bacterium HKST-UBA02]|nr:efflux RND transporter periplasmic adaptor subunit [Cyanobacteria bacterium HKST-UBA02]
MSKACWCSIIAAAVLTSCTTGPESAKHPDTHQISGPAILQLDKDQLTEIHLTTAGVESSLVDTEIELVGQVEENDYLSTPVISLVPGKIEKVLVQLGDTVRKGQVLAKIRSDEVARIEADLLKEVLGYEADIEQTKVELEVARKTFERHQQLFEEGIGARAQLETAKGELQKAEARLVSLNEKKRSAILTTCERLKLFGMTRKEIDRLLETRIVDNMFDVVSPRNGTIVERHVDIGQLLEVSQNMFVVSDLSEVWVSAQVFEKDIDEIADGDHEPAIVLVDSFPGRTFHGEVDYIGATLDPKSRTLPVRATVSNPGCMLRPRMYARMIVTIGRRRALVVPTAAVQRTGESQLVYVVRNNRTFEERKIDIEGTRGRLALVGKGLRQGEKVVVGGSLQLNGLAVKQATGGGE